jgi:hypothetical protein
MSEMGACRILFEWRWQQLEQRYGKHACTFDKDKEFQRYALALKDAGEASWLPIRPRNLSIEVAIRIICKTIPEEAALVITLEDAELLGTGRLGTFVHGLAAAVLEGHRVYFRISKSPYKGIWWDGPVIEHGCGLCEGADPDWWKD